MTAGLGRAVQFARKRLFGSPLDALITLAIYLVISLAVSGLMNWYNAKTALVTR